MGFGEKDIANILTGVNQGVNNFMTMRDKGLEYEQRAEKLRKEKETEEFTNSSVGAMKALYGVESMMGDPAFQGDVTGQAKGFLDFYNKDVPNGRQYTGASIARGQDGKAILVLTETDDQGNTRQVPADTRKLIRNTALTYSMKTGKALHDDADKYENQLKMERLRQDNRMDVLQAKVDAKGEQGSSKQKDLEYLVNLGVPREEAIRRVFGHDPAGPKDYSDKHHATVYEQTLKALVSQGYDPADPATHEKAMGAADAYIAKRQTKPEAPQAPGANPQVVQAPAPAPAAAPPLARSRAPVQSAPPPGAPTAQAAPTGAGGDPHDAISAAMRAIQSGKDPAAVKARLKQMTGLPDEYINTYIP